MDLFKQANFKVYVRKFADFYNKMHDFLLVIHHIPTSFPSDTVGQKWKNKSEGSIIFMNNNGFRNVFIVHIKQLNHLSFAIAKCIVLIITPSIKTNRLARKPNKILLTWWWTAFSLNRISIIFLIKDDWPCCGYIHTRDNKSTSFFFVSSYL